MAAVILFLILAECNCEELQQTDKAPRKVEISDIRLGYGIGQSLARRGAWFPISFEVSNPTEKSYQGHLALTGPALEHRQIAFYETRHVFELSVPAETSKRFECYARALSGQSKDAFSRKKTKLELQIRSGLAPMMKVVEEIRTLTDEEIQVLEVNRSGVPILLGREYRYSDEERAEYITFGGKQVQRETIVPEETKVGWTECATRVGDLPFRWVGYTSVDCVVWADGKMADLAPAQLHALMQFVQTGGTLIFFSGKDWSHGIGSVKEILPIESPTVHDLGSSVICTGQPRGGTLLLNVPGIGDRPMIYEMPYGMGTVSMLAFSFDGKLGRSARTNRQLWTSLLAPSGLLCRKDPGTGHNRNIESAFRKHQRLNIPQRGTIGWFLGIYVFLLVPANYALFKLLRRTIYAWCLCPVLAVVFTVGAYRYDSLSGEDVRMQLRSVVHIAPDSEVVEIISYMSIFSAYTRAYQVEVEGSDFAFSALELKAGIQDEFSNPDILYQAKTEKLNINGQGAGVISNLKIGARSRRTVVGTGILPVRARIREAFEQCRPKRGTFPGPGAFGTNAETRVYDGPFLPVLVNGKKIVPESEQTLFFVRGPQNR